MRGNLNTQVSSGIGGVCAWRLPVRIVVRFPDSRHLWVEFAVALVVVLSPRGFSLDTTFLNCNSIWKLSSISAHVYFIYLYHRLNNHKSAHLILP